MSSHDNAFTYEQVKKAVNNAADDVSGLIGAEHHAADDDLVNDTLNLTVNATLHYLEHPADSLEQAVQAHYGDIDDVLEHLRGNTAE